jgi:hypothetical protein
MLLKSKLAITHMSNTNTVTSYLMKIIELRDQLATTGEKIKSEESIPIALNGFSSSWEPFVQGVCAHGLLPNFEKLWDNFILEETKLENVSGKVEEIQNLALIRKMRGGKKGGPGGVKRQGGRVKFFEPRKKDLSHMKCFKCHEMDHYASQRLERKKTKQQQQEFVGSIETIVGADELASRLETDFSMVLCLSTNIVSAVRWYVDSVASKHMTFNKKAFNRVQE